MAEDSLIKLREAIARVNANPSSDEIHQYLPGFREYVRATLDEQAATVSAPTIEEYSSKLEFLIQLIIEDILPDRDREIAFEWAIRQDGPPEHLPGALTFASGVDGQHWRELKTREMPSAWTVEDWWASDSLKLPPSASQLAIYARHGVWEREVPGLAGCYVRHGLPGARPLREALDQELRQRLLSWIGRFRQPESPSPPGQVLARKLEHLRLECGWTWENLADDVGLHRSTVFDHASARVFPRKSTLEAYAASFSRSLGRDISPEDLLKEAAPEPSANLPVSEE